MILIKCEECQSHYCCRGPLLTPVLLPDEERKFRKYSRKIDTPSGEMRVLTKKKNGSCILFDDVTKKCTVYNKRPLECTLYPFLLDFNGALVNVKLDKRFCPQLSTLTFDKKEIIALLKKHLFPSAWIGGYETLIAY